jgi:hypothetical protein
MCSLSVTHLCDFTALQGHENTHKKCWDVEVTAVRVNNDWENGDETENHDRKKKMMKKQKKQEEQEEHEQG